ncbi:hypothetical protein DRE_02757 [Drechslerella stenobrocha 248]|uniref:Myb-like domain-containing protein n=1 Tax=Drechslerella stenobrocha 248 TaxID=1043628 RepID=W7IFF6_9PEZI|nr:hypothetical protein DRE_02757 [Drechslerella stenobrocha 248]
MKVKVESDLSLGEHESMATPTIPAIDQEVKAHTKTVKRKASPDPTHSKQPKRGRPSGIRAGNPGFTQEQDAYIIQLRQEGKDNTMVHSLFEERFRTGSNPKRIENRYFKIKDECLMSEWETGLLLQAIEEIENDMSGAVIKRFKELSNGKSVTKGYVIKQLKIRQTKTKV